MLFLVRAQAKRHRADCRTAAGNHSHVHRPPRRSAGTGYPRFPL